ncbi:N-acetylglucosamine/diacetylchitobiose ABC transporter substrate-binding protein, partial [Actinoplanes sp. NPDC051633]|uniref:N-acetylglucosamine/diacetylchitobiose ABC transporter substrate-binding protein n=1 Tax=Actinoplanes sp. NPDC051633 TaxID=3155670 RepID=UPI00344546CD
MASTISRRGLLHGAAAIGAASALTGCAMGGDSDDDSAKTDASATNPLGVKEDAPLEVVIFNGGFGEEYAKAHEAMYKERYPKATIKHSATQQISQTLQPRFVGGDPPDVVNNSGGNQIDFNGLVSEGALTDLGELLDAPSLDDPAKKVRDTLLPGIVDVGSYDGKFLSLNYAYSAYGIWQSDKLFEARGWQYPKTWDDMIALCKKFKASGIAPWTYTGVHARYMSWPILASAAKLGGVEVLKSIDNLEPNAWKQDAVKTAADAWSQLATDGFLQAGAEGMDHIQAQTEWCTGKAAFISCGSWLENEQKKVTPPDFRMSAHPTPSLTASDKLPFEAFRGTGSEPFVVPAKAKNQRGGLEYLRVMLSKKG